MPAPTAIRTIMPNMIFSMIKNLQSDCMARKKDAFKVIRAFSAVPFLVEQIVGFFTIMVVNVIQSPAAVLIVVSGNAQGRILERKR